MSLKKYNAFGIIQQELKLFGYVVFITSIYKNSGWFRIFGYGLTWKHESEPLLFSERNGYRKYIKIGKWIIGYLPKNNF